MSIARALVVVGVQDQDRIGIGFARPLECFVDVLRSDVVKPEIRAGIAVALRRFIGDAIDLYLAAIARHQGRDVLVQDIQ